jgi:arsenate reductase
MKPIRIYHNPRCSKSRQTLELLKQQGVEPQIVEYLKETPSADEIESILKMLDLEPRELMRRKESEYKELGLDNPKLDRKALIQAMVDHPKLIERPIVINQDRAAIGRPPESILEIL